MGIFSDLIGLDYAGNISLNKWVKWVHVSRGSSHCEVCLALHGCWFDKNRKPDIPQHFKCHCITIPIPKPIANYNAKAKCDIEKFENYIFADKYEWNGKKALYEKLGFNKDDAEYLKQIYELQAVQKYCDSDYKLAKLDEYGQRINIEIKLVKNDREISFISGWMVRPGGEISNNTPLAD